MPTWLPELPALRVGLGIAVSEPRAQEPGVLCTLGWCLLGSEGGVVQADGLWREPRHRGSGVGCGSA